VGSSAVDGIVRVALVEDQDVVIEGVRAWIAADPQERAVLVADGGSIEDVLAGNGRNADVVVLDLELGDRETGSKLVTDRVSGLCDAAYRVVVFSVHVEPLIVQAVLKAGASAFLDKRTERRQFVDTVVAVARDLPFVTPSMAGGMLHAATLVDRNHRGLDAVKLSDRERQALQYWFQGLDHASIARRLTKSDGKPISAGTVKQYIERARAKFAAAGRPCRSQFTLLARCIELGLIRAEEIDDYHPGDYS
jgi:two-component system, NarL family, nitrate/nitrite response regulator NarL